MTISRQIGDSQRAEAPAFEPERGVPAPYRPPSVGSLEGLLDCCYQQEGRWHAHYKGLTLTSAFQPILSVAHQRVIGHEALIRARTEDGLPVPPPELFDVPRTVPERVELDRLCRLLHVANFSEAPTTDVRWLLVNVDPQVVSSGPGFGSFFGDLLRHFRVDPSRIIVEILENQIPDEDGLAATVAYYREAGCLVAIDDFGAGHSNFDRIVRLRPNLVKLDRTMVRESACHPVAQRMFPGLIGMLHEAGCLVVAEGVETEAEAALAFESGANFIQGYLFARPGRAPDQRGTEALRDAGAASHARRDAQAQQTQRQLAPYLHRFQQVVTSRRAGVELEVACFRLLNQPGVVRCFELDAHGRQQGPNINGTHESIADPRYQPLQDTEGAAWSQSGYYRAAITAPDRLQISRPYLSLTGAHLCITLSMAIEVDGETVVVCCDLDSESLPPPE